jgi:hypothetical protein
MVKPVVWHCPACGGWEIRRMVFDYCLRCDGCQRSWIVAEIGGEARFATLDALNSELQRIIAAEQHLAEQKRRAGA